MSMADVFHFPTADKPKEIKVDTYTTGAEKPSALTFTKAE